MRRELYDVAGPEILALAQNLFVRWVSESDSVFPRETERIARQAIACAEAFMAAWKAELPEKEDTLKKS